MNEFVKCEICKRDLKIINNDHLRTHHITKEQYQQKFPDAKLVSEKTSFHLGNFYRGKKRPEHAKMISGKNNPAFGGRSKKICLNISKGRKGKGIGIAGKYLRTKAICKKISDGVTKAIIEGRIKPYKTYHGWFIAKTGKKYFYKSSWEKFVMEYLDRHPEVEFWLYESFAIPYRDCDGKQQSSLLKLPKNVDKIKALNLFLQTNEIANAFIITEKEMQMMQNFQKVN